MANVFEKLNLKNQRDIVVVSAPASFEPRAPQLDAAAAQLAEVAPGVLDTRSAGPCGAVPSKRTCYDLAESRDF